MPTNRALLLQEIKTLPESCVSEVLDFVGYLRQQEAKRTRPVAAEPTPEEVEAAEAALARGGPCPLCAKYYDPETEDPPFNEKTIAAIEEGRAMMRGEIPAKRFHSLEELLTDLRS